MFIAPEWKDADSFQLYTNASGSFGFGAYLDGAWFRGDWQPHQQLPKCSIQWAGTICHSGSSSHLGPSPGWTAHQVSLRQPAHSPGMDQPVFKAPWHNGSSKNPVLYCSQKQLYSFPGAPPRQTELHCGLAFPQSNVTLLFPCTPGQPAAHVRTSGAGRALEGRLRHLLHRAMAPLNIHHLQGRDQEVLRLLHPVQSNPSSRVQAHHQSLCCLPQPSTPG